MRAMARPKGVFLLACVALAGCSDASPAAVTELVPPTQGILGLVVSEGIVPIAGATVALANGEASTTTDDLGQFTLGPLEPGSYTVQIAADGYADATVVLPTGPDLAKVVLVAVRPDVPYIEVEKYDGYLACTFDNYVAGYQVIGAPCFGVIDLVTGVKVSQDRWQFQFTVDAPGLAGVLAEMFWEDQAFGTHMGMLLRNVAGAGSGVDAGGTNIDIQYASTMGPQPLRLRVLQGIENPGADEGAAFQVPQNDTMDYQILMLGRADRSKPADVHLMLQATPSVFLTKFYIAMGDESYTIANPA